MRAAHPLTTRLLLKVLLSLKKPKQKLDSEVAMERPFLVFHLGHLGMDTKVRKYDTCATMYISKMTLTCLEFKGNRPRLPTAIPKPEPRLPVPCDRAAIVLHQG